MTDCIFIIRLATGCWLFNMNLAPLLSQSAVLSKLPLTFVCPCAAAAHNVQSGVNLRGNLHVKVRCLQSLVKKRKKFKKQKKSEIVLLVENLLVPEIE
jgi:hypothetical protein